MWTFFWWRWYFSNIFKPLRACLQILTMYWTYGRKITQRYVIWLWFQCCNLSQRLGIWTVWKRIFFKVAIRICFMKSGSLAGCWVSRSGQTGTKNLWPLGAKFTTTFSQCTIKNRAFWLSCLYLLEICISLSTSKDINMPRLLFRNGFKPWFGWEVKH